MFMIKIIFQNCGRVIRLFAIQSFRFVVKNSTNKKTLHYLKYLLLGYFKTTFGRLLLTEKTTMQKYILLFEFRHRGLNSNCNRNVTI